MQKNNLAEEIDNALETMEEMDSILYSLWYMGAFRTVKIRDSIPLYNPINPSLSMIMFNVLPLISTPSIIEIPGVFYISNPGVDSNTVSWVKEVDMKDIAEHLKHGDTSIVFKYQSTPTEFVPLNQRSELWLRQQLARAARMRYRERPMLKPNTDTDFVYKQEL